MCDYNGESRQAKKKKKQLELKLLLDNLRECFAQQQQGDDDKNDDSTMTVTSWLDVGSGDGMLIRWLALSELGCKMLKAYDVLDPKDNVHAFLRGTEKDEPSSPSSFKIHLFNGETLPEPDASFDVVSAIFVLHHAGRKQEALLREMFRVTRQWVVLTEDVNEPQFVERNRKHDASGVFRTIQAWKELFLSLNNNVSVVREGWCKVERTDSNDCQYFFILEKH